MAIKDKVNHLHKRSIIYFLLIAIISLTVFVFYYLSRYKNNDLENESEVFIRQKLSKVFFDAGLIIKERWEGGDYENKKSSVKFSCLNELGNQDDFDLSYLRCNPNYLQCFLEGNAGYPAPKFKINHGSEKIEVIVNQIFRSPSRYKKGNRFYKIISRSFGQDGVLIDHGVMINLSAPVYPGWSMNLLLEDSCSDTYLPQRRYIYGQKKSLSSNFKGRNPFVKDAFSVVNAADSWTWDNDGRNIYIDKSLVKFREIIEWVDYSGIKLSGNLPDDPSLWWRPASGLTEAEMRSYCAYRGKQLLESHVYDAATFFVQDYKKSFEKEIFPSVYHWSLRSTDSFLHKARKGGMKKSYINRENCQRAYVYECAKIFPFNLINYQPSSWMGINDVLGGYLEAMRNPIDSNQNLKASSIYFRASSPWHVLGKRAWWDGQGFEDKNFNWLDPESGLLTETVGKLSGDHYNIGFRCMKMTEGEL